jgi:hypothetical protein
MDKRPDEMTPEEFHEWLKPYQPELLALARESLAELDAQVLRRGAGSKPEEGRAAGT